MEVVCTFETLVTRAVSGVGAPIWDFLGVSVRVLPRVLVEAGFGGEDGAIYAPFALDLPDMMKGWRIAACGLMRRSGSQTRHLAMKSTNSSSLHRKTWARFFVPGLRLLPFELMTTRGAPLGSGRIVLLSKHSDVPE
jgi:hypothetical protein